MFRRSRLVSVPAFCVAAALAGCGGGSPSVSSETSVAAAGRALAPPVSVSWLQPGLNAAHTADNTAENRLRPGNVGSLKQAWSLATGAEIITPIVTNGSMGFANSADQYLYALDATSGAEEWRFQTFWGGYLLNQVIASGNLVYVSCLVGGSQQEQGLCAVDASTGKLKWTWYEDCGCQPAATMYTGPVVSGSTVVFGYFGGGNSGPFDETAVDAATGKLLWQKQMPLGFSDSTPAISGGTVYVGASFSGLCSLQLSNGSLNWCVGPGDSGISPTVYKGVVYINTYSHGFYAFNAKTGKQIWQYVPTAGNSAGFYDPPAISNSRVYFSGVGSSANLYALNARTGSLIFTTANDGAGADTWSSPSVAHGVVYAGCQDGLCAFNGSTGALLFTSGGTGADYGASLAVANGKVYGVCGSKDVCMYDLSGPNPQRVRR